MEVDPATYMMYLTCEIVSTYPDDEIHSSFLKIPYGSSPDLPNLPSLDDLVPHLKVQMIANPKHAFVLIETSDDMRKTLRETFNITTKPKGLASLNYLTRGNEERFMYGKNEIRIVEIAIERPYAALDLSQAFVKQNNVALIGIEKVPILKKDF